MDDDLMDRLEEILGHPAPFGAEEIGRLETVVLSYCGGLQSVVGQLNAVRTLTAIGAEWRGDGWPERLDRLFALRLAYASVRAVSLQTCPRLRRIDLRATLVTDLGWLLDAHLPALEEVILDGCPLSAEAHETQLPALRARTNATWEESVEVVFNGTDPGVLSRAILARGIRAVYDDHRGCVSAPGQLYSKLPDLHSWTVSHDDVKRVLDQVDDGDLSGFMDRCRDIAHGK